MFVDEIRIAPKFTSKISRRGASAQPTRRLRRTPNYSPRSRLLPCPVLAAGTELRSRCRLPESEVLGVAREERVWAERVCGDVHGLTRAVTEACDRLITEIGPGPGRYLGPVDVMGVQNGHDEGGYDALWGRALGHISVAEMTPDELVSRFRETMRIRHTTLHLRLRFNSGGRQLGVRDTTTSPGGPTQGGWRSCGLPKVSVAA
jgi:hypothetical protein